MNRGSATGSNNLIQATAKACGLTHGTNNNIVGQDPLRATLADNGCATPAGGACVRTHALGAGSNPNNLTTD